MTGLFPSARPLGLCRGFSLRPATQPWRPPSSVPSHAPYALSRAVTPYRHCADTASAVVTSQSGLHLSALLAPRPRARCAERHCSSWVTASTPILASRQQSLKPKI